MKKSLIIGIVAVLILIVAGYFILNWNTLYPSATSDAQNKTQPAAATITYSDNGFSPNTTTVKSGETVAIKNDSSNAMQFDSGPHPEHTDDTDLNVGIVNAGQTKTFIVTKKGTFSVHNHLDSSHTATITIH